MHLLTSLILRHVFDFKACVCRLTANFLRTDDGHAVDIQHPGGATQLHPPNLYPEGWSTPRPKEATPHQLCQAEPSCRYHGNVIATQRWSSGQTDQVQGDRPAHTNSGHLTHWSVDLCTINGIMSQGCV